MPLGRPPEYQPEYAEQAEKLCRMGMTDAELAQFFEVDPLTIWRWKNRHDAFCKALTRGKEVADDAAEATLYKRATGYSHGAVKIFMPAGAEEPVYAPYIEHLPPDVGALKLWLTNRRPEQWRDRVQQEITGKDGGPLETKATVDVSGLTPEQLRALAAIPLRE